MSEITMKDDFRKEEESNELFSLQTIWGLFCQNWYWVLISALICVGVAFVYLRFKTPVYSASMKVLVKESGDKKNAYNSTYSANYADSVFAFHYHTSIAFISASARDLYAAAS